MERKRLSGYDGQSLFVEGKRIFELGNYLGGGASGNVYEAVHVSSCKNYAIKILHPVGFKLTRSSVLARFQEVSVSYEYWPGFQKRGTAEAASPENSPDGKVQIRWLLNPTSKQLVATYQDEKTGSLREIPLTGCVEIWGENVEALEEENIKKQIKVTLSIGRRGAIAVSGQGRVINVPRIPEKYVMFLKARQQIMREIQTMSKVSGHENVLQLYKVLELLQDSKSTLFLILELASSGELFDRIRVDEGCDEETACTYFRQVLSGVAYCHERGVCHRDLKPENLLLAETEEGTVIKIADFGLSALFSANKFGSTGAVKVTSLRGTEREGHKISSKSNIYRLMSVVGSPHYVAPEVLKACDDGYDGAKADVWSLGVILYAMLAGNLPFGKDLLRCPRFEEFCRWRRSVKLEASSVSPERGEQSPQTNRVPYPTWFFPRHLSVSVRSLIVALFDPDPTSRINVYQAREHAWIMFGGREMPEAASQAPILEDMPDNDTETNRPIVASRELEQEDDGMPFSDEECGLTNRRVRNRVQSEDCESDSDNDDDIFDNRLPGPVASSYISAQSAPMAPVQNDRQGSDPQLIRGAVMSHLIREECRMEPHDCASAPIRNSLFFQSPPLAPVKAGTTNIPRLMLGPLCRSPASQVSLPPRRHHRSLSPPRRASSDEGEVCRDYNEGVSEAQYSRTLRNCFEENMPVSDQLIRSEARSTLLSSCQRLGQNETKTDAEMVPRRPSSAGSVGENLPRFTDVVKRSTRFSTAVPAAEVLQRIASIVDGTQYYFQKFDKSHKQRAVIDWDNYKLDIIQGTTRLCTVRIFLLKASLYMVEFIRGQINIFEFKQLYDNIREQLGEIVKNDYTLSMLDIA